MRKYKHVQPQPHYHIPALQTQHHIYWLPTSRQLVKVTAKMDTYMLTLGRKIG